MTRILLGALTATLFLAAGCSSTNRIVGHEMIEAGHWYGELGITGHLNKITVEPRSRLTKLSIFGDANQVDVENNVALGKIEIYGENNVVTIPEHLVVRVAQIGDGNRVVRRGSGGQALSRNAADELVPFDEAEAGPVTESPDIAGDTGGFEEPDVNPE